MSILEGCKGNPKAAGAFFTLTMSVGKNPNVLGFYHRGEPMTKAASAEAAASQNDTYYYDAATGIITYSTDDFSPFTVVISDSVFNGGGFKNYNPGVTTVDPVNEKTGTIVLDTGCTTTERVDGSDTWYTVSK